MRFRILPLDVVLARTDNSVGLKGAVVGEGDTYEEALGDVRSAIRFHVETFGPEVLEES
jgi:hypothetical protein